MFATLGAAEADGASRAVWAASRSHYAELSESLRQLAEGNASAPQAAAPLRKALARLHTNRPRPPREDDAWRLASLVATEVVRETALDRPYADWRWFHQRRQRAGFGAHAGDRLNRLTPYLAAYWFAEDKYLLTTLAAAGSEPEAARWRVRRQEVETEMAEIVTEVGGRIDRDWQIALQGDWQLLRGRVDGLEPGSNVAVALGLAAPAPVVAAAPPPPAEPRPASKVAAAKSPPPPQLASLADATKTAKPLAEAVRSVREVPPAESPAPAPAAADVAPAPSMPPAVAEPAEAAPAPEPPSAATDTAALPVLDIETAAGPVAEAPTALPAEPAAEPVAEKELQLALAEDQPQRVAGEPAGSAASAPSLRARTSEEETTPVAWPSPQLALPATGLALALLLAALALRRRRAAAPAAMASRAMVDVAPGAPRIQDLLARPGHTLTADERALMGDVLTRLFRDLDAGERREWSERLARKANAPRYLVAALAADDIGVALPVLAASEALEDDDLIEVVRRRSPQHQAAVAMRRPLSARVAASLIAGGQVGAIAALLENEAAEMPADALALLVEQSRRIAAYRTPLLRRAELSAEQARRLYWWASHEQRAAIRQRFNLGMAQLGAVAEVEPPTDDVAPADEERLSAAAITPQLLLDLLQGGKHAVFEALFGELSGLRGATLERVLYEPSGEELAIACRAVEIDRVAFPRLFLLARMGRRAEGDPRDMARALAAFDRTSADAARRVLAGWAGERQGGSAGGA
jgi:uncharacterized protein (DUF2336 family)